MSAFLLPAFFLYCVSSSVKPNAPCCLKVEKNTSQHNFTWKSTYESTTGYTRLMNFLTYELQYYKRQGNQRVSFFFFLQARIGIK